jgi:hypothetical protein
LVLVFENNRILPSERRGALAIRGILLTTNDPKSSTETP